jgi:zinc transport system permease protein
MLLSIFHYSFIMRGLEAGLIVAIIAPLIGIFLVLRRYALIVDALAHVSLTGVAVGLLLGINPLLCAMGASIVGAVGAERLRFSKKIYSESVLALLISGSLALAVVLLSLAHSFNANLFSYLFGSIVTVSQSDIYLMGGIGLVVIIVLLAFYKEFIYLAFDEEAAAVSGLPTKFLNIVLIVLAALTIAVAIPVVGVLLIAALVVIPVVSALQFKQSFTKTILIAEMISILSVVIGIFISFYFGLAAGGTIVLLLLAIFGLNLLWRSRKV